MSMRLWVAPLRCPKTIRVLIPQYRDLQREYRKRELAVPFSF